MRNTFLLLAILVVAGCQNTPSEPENYQDLTRLITAGEQPSVDDLAASFMAMPDMPDKMKRLIELEQQALQMVDDEPLKLGSIGSAILDTYYGSLTGHFVMARFYTHLENADAAAPHLNWQQNISLAMAHTADGSRDNPFFAMSGSDAEIYSRLQGNTTVGSIYQTSDEIPFALLLQVRPEQGSLENLYFDLNNLYRSVELEIEAESAEASVRPLAMMGYLARNRDSAAQAAIGHFLHVRGRTIDAIGWLRAASDTGNIIANVILAQVFWQQANTTDDPDTRERALERVMDNYLHAIGLGSSDAMYALAVLYLGGNFGEENEPSAIPLLKQAGDLDHSESLLYLGHLYYAGDKVEQSLSSAEAYFVRSAELDNQQAQLSYARYLMREKDNAAGDERIIDWLTALADEDDPQAMLLLGNLYARGVSTQQSTRRAISWYKNAVKTAPVDPDVVNEVAWTMAVSDVRKLRNARYAQKIMDNMMNEDADARQSPEYLDTWAATYAGTGDFEEALRLQNEALSQATKANREDVIDVLKDHLSSFEAGKDLTEVAP
ncbi:MAG: tetratricopeptide repeat protein [Proteobacteria bacterium]|nr:tetratricopeptide repeat protein [Pseudomonadota bacterium]